MKILMKRLVLLTVLSLTFAAQVYSQKVHRAAKAMNELKFEKSFELFDEVLEKEPDNVVALVGFAKARLKENELQLNRPSLDLLQLCFDNLLKGKNGIKNINEDEAKILMNDLRVFNEYSIDTLLAQTSNLIWNYYIKEEKSISKFEFFQANYYKENFQNPAKLVGYKLDKLYYDSLSNVNTFSGYNFYLDKFDKNKNQKGIYSNDVKSKILDIEYKEAIEAKGATRLIMFVAKYKIKNLEGIARTTFEALLIPATKEIEKREYARAIASPGVALLEEYVNNYKNAEEAKDARDSIEYRYYNEAQSTHLLTNYENFLNKYKSSIFKNQIEDSVVAMRFRNTIVSDNKLELVNFIEQLNKFHESVFIQSIADSTKNKIYNLEYTEAINSNDLVIILEFYRKHKNSNYSNIGNVQKKLFAIWEQSIIKNYSVPVENGLVNFIQEFNTEPATAFNKVIDATKVGFLKYLENLKPRLVSDLLLNSSRDNENIYYSLSTEKLESLSNVIANRLFITNNTSNSIILDNLKNLNLETSNSLQEIFISFFNNFTVSNSYIESFYNNNDRCFLFGYQTKEKFNIKFIVWDDIASKYKEIEVGGKDTNLLKSFMYQYGITNIPAYMGASRSKYNYVIIGSKINYESLINISQAPSN